MDGEPIELMRPGLVDAIKDLDAMAIWECLRRRKSPCDLAGLAKSTGRSHEWIRPRLARLERAGLVTVRRAGRRRATIAYQAAVRRISLVVDPGDPRQLAIVDAIVGYLQRDLAGQLFRHPARLAPAGPDRWNYHHCSPIALDADELDELKRRIARVEEYLKVLNDKRADEAKIQFCNHAIAIRIQPLDEPVLPQPHVEFLSRRSAEERRTSRGLLPRPLTPRELEIARGLRDGASRAEVARRLGISILTVGTLCKRIYKKLGIRRSADLHHFSLD